MRQLPVDQQPRGTSGVFHHLALVPSDDPKEGVRVTGTPKLVGRAVVTQSPETRSRAGATLSLDRVCVGVPWPMAMTTCEGGRPVPSRPADRPAGLPGLGLALVCEKYCVSYNAVRQATN